MSIELPNQMMNPMYKGPANRLPQRSLNTPTRVIPPSGAVDSDQRLAAAELQMLEMQSRMRRMQVITRIASPSDVHLKIS